MGIGFVRVMVLFVLSAASALFECWTAAAAVRVCQPPVSSGFILGPTEEEARQKTMRAWRDQALSFGEPYSSWRIASNKLFQCLPHEGGAVACIASGEPCIIDQAPSRRQLREKRIDM